VALWRHIAPGKTAARRYLGIGACVWIFFTVLQWIFRIFRNFAWHRPRTRAELSQVNGALLVSVTVPRPWRVKAGQYVYLSVPRAGFWSIFQRHPFMISSWNEGTDGLTVELLVKPRRGFTHKLIRCTEYFAVSAFIDGPFGVGHDFSEYGTVLMFATGIGVAGHLPYINELVQGYIHCEVKTRHIALVWLIDKDGEICARQCDAALIYVDRRTTMG
jgi:predicted ferric reductase